MSIDLLDRLVCDIVAVTESLMSAETKIDLACWDPFSMSVEKRHASMGVGAKQREAGEHERGPEVDGEQHFRRHGSSNSSRRQRRQGGGSRRPRHEQFGIA